MNKSKVDVKISSWNGKYNIVTLESEKIEVLDSYRIFTEKIRIVNSSKGSTSFFWSHDSQCNLQRFKYRCHSWV